MCFSYCFPVLLKFCPSPEQAACGQKCLQPECLYFSIWPGSQKYLKQNLRSSWELPKKLQKLLQMTYDRTPSQCLLCMCYSLYYVVYFKLLRYYFQADNTEKSLAEKYDRMKLCLLLVSQH